MDSDEDDEKDFMDSEEDDEYSDEENTENDQADPAERYQNKDKENEVEVANVSICSTSIACKKCGSVTHKRSNHKACPYNKNRKSF